MKQAVDLFCGAGGTSTGVLQAAAELGQRVNLLAINHWNVAIDTHTRNHPHVRHLCESLDSIDPRKAVKGRLHLLTASPECTHHSIARGGKPCSDQSRASAWHVVRWAEAKQPEAILVENVREFRNWGPLDDRGRPLKRRSGETFRAWLGALESVGYHVDHRLINAADYGDATTRIRLFVLARRGKRPEWPAPSHVMRWRPAREIIDWSVRGRSIFGRQRPLSEKTLRRIAAGLARFGGEPFLMHCTHTGGDRVSSLGNPLPTVTGARRGEMALLEPFLVYLRGTSPAHLAASCQPVSEPLRTLTASGTHAALCEPFVLGQQSGATARPVSEPLPTVATAGAIALIEPFLVKYYGTGMRAIGVSEPVDTITTKDRFGLVEPANDGTRIDIRFRMLQPHELAAAMSFPTDYQFAGNREAQVKQIGNAVPVRTAAALAKSLLA